MSVEEFSNLLVEKAEAYIPETADKKEDEVLGAFHDKSVGKTGNKSGQLLSIMEGLVN